MCRWGKLWTRCKKTRNPSAPSKEQGANRVLGAKTGYYAHTLTKGVGKPHKPALWPDHWAHPYPHPILGTSLLPA